MGNPITGVIHVTGEPDTGKTTFAIANGFHPSDIVFFDDDVKSKAIARMLEEAGTPFGKYYNLTELGKGLREIEFYDLVMGKINSLEKGKYKAIIFDTWTRFENTFFPIVQKDPMKYKAFYSAMGKIKTGEMWRVSFELEAQILDQLQEIAPLIILTTHLKDKYIDNARTGAQIPESKKAVTQKSRFRVWLRHNPQSPAPIGLVLKRPNKVTVTDAGIEAVNILPRKLNPCTWQRIMEYWNNPIGNAEPKPEEMPNEFELSILDGVLTSDQKDALAINRLELEKERLEAMKPKITTNMLIEKYGAENVMNGLVTVFGGKEPENQDQYKELESWLKAQ